MKSGSGSSLAYNFGRAKKYTCFTLT